MAFFIPRGSSMPSMPSRNGGNQSSSQGAAIFGDNFPGGALITFSALAASDAKIEI
jgi:hypothetical protein